MKKILTLLTCLLLVACTSATKPNMKRGKTKSIEGLPSLKEYSIIGYDDNKLYIGAYDVLGPLFDAVLYYTDVYVYDVKSNKIAEVIELESDVMVIDFLKTETGYIYTYGKNAEDGYEFGYVQQVGAETKAYSYIHDDINKAPRLFKTGVGINLLMEIKEDQNPQTVIYKFLGEEKREIYRKDVALLNTRVYPSDNGYIFVEYEDNRSRLMRNYDYDIARMYSIEFKVQSIFAHNNHTYMQVLDGVDAFAINEDGTKEALQLADFENISLDKDMYITNKEFNTLVLNYMKDLKNEELIIELPELENSLRYMFKIDSENVLLVYAGFEFVEFNILKINK